MFNYKEYNHKYYLKHRKYLLLNQKKYNITHRKEISLRMKLWCELHKEEKAIYMKKYALKNCKELMNRKNRYIYQRRRKDINFRLLCNLRARIYNTLQGFNKAKHTQEILGCSIDFLKNHLESQFKPGMTWKNYGKWEIDHIRPCCSFDLSKVLEQKKCFNWRNLQPLWAKENHKKNKY